MSVQDQDIPMENLSTIAANVDKINRGGAAGGSVDVSQTILSAHTALIWLVSIKDIQKAFGDETGKTCATLSDRGKRLYLQAQNLPVSSTLISNLRAILLCLGAMMLARFKTNLPATLQAQLFLKLSSAASDVSNVAAVGAATTVTEPCWEKASAHCCIQALEMQQKLDLNTLAQCISNREIEQIQLASLTQYLHAARFTLLMKNAPNEQFMLLLGKNTIPSFSRYKVAREFIHRASLCTQDLPSSAIVHFCEALLVLAEELHINSGDSDVCMDMQKDKDRNVQKAKDKEAEEEEDSVMEEAFHMLSFALERLELCLATSTSTSTSSATPGMHTNSLNMATANALHLNIMFSLAHVQCQLGQHQQALGVIESAEKKLLDIKNEDNDKGSNMGTASSDIFKEDNDKREWHLNFLIPYAKFHIYASDKQWTQAKTHLLSVIKSQSNVQTCLQLIQRYMDGHTCSLDVQRELYQQCALAFPAMPAHSQVLLARLKTLVATSPAAGADSAPTKEALVLARDIVTSHIASEAVLDKEEYWSMCSILRSRITYCIAAGHWGLVEHWAGLLLLIIGTDKGKGNVYVQIEQQISSKDVLLLRAYARMQMLRHVEAQEDCEKAWVLEPGQDTAIASFQAGLHVPIHALVSASMSQEAVAVAVPAPKTCVLTFINRLESLRTMNKIAHNEQLLLLAQAARIARESATVCKSRGDMQTVNVSMQSFSDLLHQWLAKYEQVGAWRKTPPSPSRHPATIPNTDVRRAMSMSTSMSISDTDAFDLDPDLNNTTTATATATDTATSTTNPSCLRIAAELLQNDINDILMCRPPSGAVTVPLVFDTDFGGSCRSNSSDDDGDSCDSDKENHVRSDSSTIASVSSADSNVSANKRKKSNKTTAFTSTSNAMHVTSSATSSPKGPRRRLLRRPAMEQCEAAEALMQLINPDGEVEGEVLVTTAVQHQELEQVTATEQCHDLEMEMEMKMDHSTATVTATASANVQTVEQHDILPSSFPSPLPLQEEEEVPAVSTGTRTSPISFFRMTQLASTDETFLDRGNYEFTVPLSKIQNKIITTLQTVIRTMSMAAQENMHEQLGSFSEALWLADLSWNLANLLVHKDMCRIPAERVEKASADTDTDSDSDALNIEDVSRLLLAAQLFEISQNFYQACLNYEQGKVHYLTICKNQRSCLLVGAASRLDAHDLALGGKATGSTISTCAGEDMEEMNITHALQSAGSAAKRAFDLLRKDGGFQDAETTQLRHMSLLLLFTVLCRGGSSDSSCDRETSPSAAVTTAPAAVFVDTYIEELRFLGVNELLRLATVAAVGPCCPASVTYRLLTLAWEHSLQPAIPGDEYEGSRKDLAAAADIQCRLLLLAPSPSAALEHVRNVSEMCTKTSTSNDIDADTDSMTIIPVRSDTADHATAVTFNYGVTLSELGQSTLSEKFLAQAVALLPYCSPTFRSAWSMRMENAYFTLLQKLLPQKVGKRAGEGLASFGLISARSA